MNYKIKLPTYLPLLQLKTVFKILSSNGNSRLVGGCVRDILKGIEPKDYDIATSVEANIAIDLLKNAGIKTIPTGMNHGTFTALVDNLVFEITTLRTDINCDGRHASVMFTKNWQEDAERRDFTINSMYLDLSGNLYDYYGGLNDLNNNLIKFVGDADKRIAEDHLRILRYFRFYGYLGGNNFHDGSLQAVIRNADLIKNLSGERIQNELCKILNSAHINQTLKIIFENDILKAIGLSNTKLEFQNIYFSNNCIINLAVLIKLLNFNWETTRKFAKRIKLSNKHTNFLQKICYQIDSYKLSLNGKLYYYGADLTKAYLSLKYILQPSEEYFHNINIANSYTEKKLPVNGTDLINAGFAGKMISSMIKFLEEKWIAEDFKLNKQGLLNEIKKHTPADQ